MTKVKLFVDRIVELEERMAREESELGRHESRLDGIEERLERLEKRMNNADPVGGLFREPEKPVTEQDCQDDHDQPHKLFKDDKPSEFVSIPMDVARRFIDNVEYRGTLREIQYIIKQALKQ